MLDAEMLGHKGMLSSHVIEDRDPREWFDVGVRWGCGLSIPKEGSDHNEILLGIQNMVFTNEPLVVRNCFNA